MLLHGKYVLNSLSCINSHTATQRADGLAGALIVDDPDDPVTSQVDEEFVVFLQDWYHDWSDDLYREMQGPKRIFPIAIMAILFNGKAHCTCSTPPVNNCPGCANAAPVKLERFALQKGLVYRFRLISGSTNSLMRFKMDGHLMKVVAADNSYVEPFQLDTLIIDGGQRYDVLITGTGQSGYMRAQRQSIHAPAPESHAELVYANSSLPPTIPAGNYSGTWKTLQNKQARKLAMLNGDGPPESYDELIVLNLFDTIASTGWWNWTINKALYADPLTVPVIFEPNFEPALRFEYGKTYDVVWQNLNSEETHPIHQHGPPFWLISSGNSLWNETTPESVVAFHSVQFTNLLLI